MAPTVRRDGGGRGGAAAAALCRCGDNDRRGGLRSPASRFRRWRGCDTRRGSSGKGPSGIFDAISVNVYLETLFLNVTEQALRPPPLSTPFFASGNDDVLVPPVHAVNAAAAAAVQSADQQPSVATIPRRSPRHDNQQQLQSPLVRASDFMQMTKKLRHQYLLSVIGCLRSNVVTFNVKCFFRIYYLYHRDDALMYTICASFGKHMSFDVHAIREEILRRNTKRFKHKSQRNPVCNYVMGLFPSILRLFDRRELLYCVTNFTEQCGSLHDLCKRLPLMMCLCESDVDEMIRRCRASVNRRLDFPIDLLPRAVRGQFAHLLNVQLSCGE